MRFKRQHWYTCKQWQYGKCTVTQMKFHWIVSHFLWPILHANDCEWCNINTRIRFDWQIIQMNSWCVLLRWTKRLVFGWIFLYEGVIKFEKTSSLWLSHQMSFTLIFKDQYILPVWYVDRNDQRFQCSFVYFLFHAKRSSKNKSISYTNCNFLLMFCLKRSNNCSNLFTLKSLPISHWSTK